MDEASRADRRNRQADRAEQPAGRRQVPLEFIEPNPRNPRRILATPTYGSGAVDSRAWPRPAGGGPAIAGQPGRYRDHRRRTALARGAAGRADRIPIIVRDVNDRTALELAIIENVQRTDLNPVEEALGYQQLIDDHSYTQADLGQVIGKSRSHVANTLRLLKLPDVIRRCWSMAICRRPCPAHWSRPDPAGLAKRIVEEGLSVRQAEALAQQPVKQAQAHPADRCATRMPIRSRWKSCFPILRG